MRAPYWPMLTIFNRTPDALIAGRRRWPARASRQDYLEPEILRVALDPRTVTAADMVACRVRLDISCMDREGYTARGWVAAWQSGRAARRRPKAELAD
jgi:hypothetical protein